MMRVTSIRVFWRESPQGRQRVSHICITPAHAASYRKACMQHGVQSHTSGNIKCCVVDVVQVRLACCQHTSRLIVQYILGTACLDWLVHVNTPTRTMLPSSPLFMHLSAWSRLLICLAAFISGTGGTQVANNSNSTGLLCKATKQGYTVRVDAEQFNAQTHTSWFGTFVMQETMHKTWCCTVTRHAISHQDPEGQYAQCYLTTLSIDRLTRPGYICSTWSSSVMKYTGLRF